MVILFHLARELGFKARARKWAFDAPIATKVTFARKRESYLWAPAPQIDPILCTSELYTKMSRGTGEPPKDFPTNENSLFLPNILTF